MLKRFDLRFDRIRGKTSSIKLLKFSTKKIVESDFADQDIKIAKTRGIVGFSLIGA